MIYPGGEIMKHAKMFAFVAVLVMVFAGLVVAIDISDDSDAADKTVNYQFNLQLSDGTNKVTDDLKVQKETNISKDSYLKALKAALDDGGYTYVIKDSGWITSITKDDVTYASKGTWEQEGYYGFAIYYPVDGGWNTTSTYDESTTFSIVLDEYKFTNPASDKYKDSGFGYWTLLPTVNVVDYTDGKYHFNLQLNNGEKSINVWLKAQSTSSLSKDAYVKALKAALDDGGYTYVIKDSGWITSITKDDVTYASKGTWEQEGYYGFGVYYANGEYWLPTGDYSEGNVFSIVLDEYKFTDPKSDAYYDSGFGYWVLLPTESTDAYEDGGSNNLVLYIVIGVVAVVAIAAVAFFVIKK